MKTSVLLCAFALCTMVLTKCAKEQNGTSKMTLKMTDAPGDFQQVNIEVLRVEVHHGTQGWITLPTNQGVYDLLTLQNDVTATLVNGGQLPSGQIDQFRLILGSNNYVMVDSLFFPLATPSAQQSGLKLNVNYTFNPNQSYEMLLDFDAAQSIVIQGNGSYSLKPKISLLAVNAL